MRRIFLTTILIMGLFGAVAPESAAQPVKKSKSGICHCPGGSYYEKTKNFTPFDTIKACLDGGGREPKRGQGDCSKASPLTTPGKAPEAKPKAEAAPVAKPVVSVIDGDTINLAGVRVRLAAIDAPESGQSCRNGTGQTWPCGEHATTALVLNASGGVRCAPSERDRYGRVLAICYAVDGTDINRWMVRQGHALAYRQYSELYVADEEQAKAEKKGMHRGTFVPPWDWRRGIRLP